MITIPHGRTAQRLPWDFLPAALRAMVERRLGGPVVGVDVREAGFTSGMAAVLETEGGSRLFVKAAHTTAQRPAARGYRREGRMLDLLPEGLPAPRLAWCYDHHDWVVLGQTALPGEAPRRPWETATAEAVVHTLERVAEQTAGAPELDRLPELREEFGGLDAAWDSPAVRALGLPHHDEAAALAARFGGYAEGDQLVHTDPQADNLLIDGDRVHLVDWKWPARGPAWVDVVLVLLQAEADGVEVERLLANGVLTGDLPAEAVDSLLALHTGSLFASAASTPPRSSPYLRAWQRTQAEASWSWLCRRRGWPSA